MAQTTEQQIEKPRQEEEHSGAHHHIVSPKSYAIIIGILMVLLVITFWAAEQDFGAFNVPIALAIAVTKALLIMLFFMHLKYSSKLIWIFAAAAFVFVGIMFAETFNDYLTRSYINMPGIQMNR